MLVINFAGDPEQKDKEVVAINPVVIDSKGVFKDREGCLSFPGLYQDIRRAKTVTVQYYTLDGEAKQMTCSELPSRVWQHEIDHVNGILFIDKMGPLAKMGAGRRLEGVYLGLRHTQRRRRGPCRRIWRNVCNRSES